MHYHSEAMHIAPGGWLGMLGGGQLGRMFCQAAQRLGYRVAVLDPDPQSPAGALADLHIACAYDDTDGLARLSQHCEAVTTEFENIPAQSLALLARNNVVRPGAGAVEIVQDRLREKAFLRDMGAPVAPYAEIRGADALAEAPDRLFPGILKAARFGYDGKGQARVHSRQEAVDAFAAFGAVECVLESLLPLAAEVSVVLARDHKGNTQCYPPVGNEHRDGILAVSTADVLAGHPERAAQASGLACAIADALDYTGVLCVEFFILQDGCIVVNEIAPRPHNSGHYTLDAAVTSQFEQQARVLAGMPLGCTATLRPAIMLNILGDIWFRPGCADAQEPAWHEVLAVPGAHLHLYGKAGVRRGRKMGHVNIVAETMEETRQNTARVADILGIAYQS